MTRTFGKPLTALAAIAALYLLPMADAGLSRGTAMAQDDEEGQRPPPPTRSSETLSRAVYTRIEDVMECRDEEDLPCMKEIMDEIYELYERDRLNTREKQTMFQFYAVIAQMEEDYPAALRWNREILGLEELAPELMEQTWNSVGMLHYVLEEYEEAIDAFESLLAISESPSDDVYLRLAYAHYQLEQYREAIPPLLTNFELLRAQGEEVPKNSYSLLRALYLTLEDYENAYQVVREEVILFNEPDQWIMLARLSAQLEKFDAQAHLYWAAGHGNFLDSEGEFVTLAQLLSQYENPFGCGETMASALEEGIVAGEADNYKLAAQCYQLAREYAMAVPFLENAVEVEPSAENYSLLGRGYLFAEDFENAATAFDNAFEEDDLENGPQLALQAASANLQLRNWDEARRYARIAMDDEDTEGTARSWLQVIDNEQRQYETRQQRRQELAGYFRD